jgi:hypothetical protein
MAARVRLVDQSKGAREHVVQVAESTIRFPLLAWRSRLAVSQRKPTQEFTREL